MSVVDEIRDIFVFALPARCDAMFNSIEILLRSLGDWIRCVPNDFGAYNTAVLVEKGTSENLYKMVYASLNSLGVSLFNVKICCNSRVGIIIFENDGDADLFQLSCENVLLRFDFKPIMEKLVRNSQWPTQLA